MYKCIDIMAFFLRWFAGAATVPAAGEGERPDSSSSLVIMLHDSRQKRTLSCLRSDSPTHHLTSEKNTVVLLLTVIACSFILSYIGAVGVPGYIRRALASTVLEYCTVSSLHSLYSCTCHHQIYSIRAPEIKI